MYLCYKINIQELSGQEERWTIQEMKMATDHSWHSPLLLFSWFSGTLADTVPSTLYITRTLPYLS